MEGLGHVIGARGLNTGLRALFCVCLLLSTGPAVVVTKPSSEAADGVGTPPPALLEPGTRSGTLSAAF